MRVSRRGRQNLNRFTCRGISHFLSIGLAAVGIRRDAACRILETICTLGCFAGTVILLVLSYWCRELAFARQRCTQRWIRFLGISAQPSELAKIAIPLMMCWIVDRNRHRLTGWIPGTLPFLFPILLSVPLVLIEPDLGTAVFLLGGAVLVLFAGGWPLRNFLVGIVLAVPAALGALAMKPYQRQRIAGFLQSWANFDDAPYQLKQSLVTMGAGGFSGVGLGRGWQKLSFLPEANTDFVFAVIGEELGLIGTLGLIALWCGLYLTGLRMLNHLDHRRFTFLAGFTLLTQLTAQAMLNIAVVTAMVPPKGISHPLISAGGSSLVVSLLAIGIVISLSRGTDDEQTQAVLGDNQFGPAMTGL